MRFSSFLLGSLRGIMTLSVPFLLVMLAARLVMTPLYMQIQYNRPNFAPDAYGFTAQDRLQYAPYGLEYLFNNADVSFLGDLTLPGEKCFPPQSQPCPMFNPSELQHMVDVKVVTVALFNVGIISGGLFIFGAILFYRLGDNYTLRYIVIQGSYTTIVLFVSIAFFAIFMWDAFFSTFHSLFFVEGTWVFYYSDTLIRLYPEQFWLDATILLGFLACFSALVLSFIARRVKLNSVHSSH
jgi:integral membrane protein (TIGR01906 family)